jgi:serine phosphatase RsbU (regulator of sigma subunit)
MTAGPEPGLSIDLGDTEIVIGRGRECDLVLRDQFKAVSNRHARIVPEADGSWSIEDLNSLNGTEVDGEVIHGGRAGLRHGSRIRIINYHFVCRLNDDTTMIKGVVNAASSSDEIVQVRPQEKLKGLLEICQALGRSKDPDEIASRALECLFDVFPESDHGLVVLDGAEGPGWIARHRAGRDSAVHFSRTLYGRVLSEAKALLCQETLGGPASAESIAYSEAFMMMCAPLFDHQRRPIGMIQVDTSRRKGHFTQEDLDLLAAVAGPVGTFIENARLQRLAGEVRQAERDAREFQRALLPVERPSLPGYCFWDGYEPAEFVGGDFFDYLPLPPNGRPGRWGVAVADVVGKAMPAAKLMARASTLLRRAVMAEPGPAAIVGRINHELCVLLDDPERYVTLVLGVLDPADHSLTVVRAGHPDPLVRRADGRVEDIAPASKGTVMGFDPKSTYNEVTITLAPGDMVVLYSDGLTDGHDRSGRGLGREGLVRALKQVPADIEAAGHWLLDRVRAFTADQPQSDDITLVCFGRVKEG